jgi:hypothetical protein
MFKEITMLKLICDRCGKDAGVGGVYSCWECKEGFDDMFDENGWLSIDGKHYCPKCWEYDDNDNERVVK